MLPDVVAAKGMLPMLVVASPLPLPPTGSIVADFIIVIIVRFTAPALAEVTHTGFDKSAVFITGRHSQTKLDVKSILVRNGALLIGGYPSLQTELPS